MAGLHMATVRFALCSHSPAIRNFLPGYYERTEFPGKRYIIMGEPTGCDSGFGHYTALKLADLGVTVFAGCLSLEGEEKLRNLRPNLDNLHTVSLNVLSDISVEEAEKNVRLISGPHKLWALVNNAGISLVSGPDDFTSIDIYRRHMEVNFLGHMRVTHAFKQLIKDSQGRIIFVTSIQGRLAIPETAPYNASKWATEAYADSLRRELWDFGVRVLVIQPGGFQTKLNDSFGEKYKKLWENLPESTKVQYGEEYFKNRLSLMRDIPLTQSPNTEMVPGAIADAVFSRFSRYRYVVGDKDMRLFVSILPEWLQDFYFRWQMSHLEKPAVVMKKSKDT